MSDIFAFCIAIILTLPLPFLIIFYLCARKWSRHKLKALHRTANFTAPIFILASHVLLIVLFERSFFPIIVIFLLLLLGLSLVAQYKLNEEVRLIRAFKGFWRVSFLLFMFFYMGLSVFGLIDRLFFS
ncbi:DUF3397 domain-containing protein [Halobacillus litoralis]|uniref:DUF3397 domain-containing protein n=1 Tax=Halobacillus litoralis TaxID=45668 RepID=A0A410M8T2_9BACI|nr:DUF3397 domain-containing protein [Halobacillus litoralis]QAS51106.1 DUF3397 domain-containing protein [Halobacillus litoralis]